LCLRWLDITDKQDTNMNFCASLTGFEDVSSIPHRLSGCWRKAQRSHTSWGETDGQVIWSRAHPIRGSEAQLCEKNRETDGEGKVLVCD